MKTMVHDIIDLRSPCQVGYVRVCKQKDTYTKGDIFAVLDKK
jgi:hypothetical protein